jgi:hypothetical protein
MAEAQAFIETVFPARSPAGRAAGLVASPYQYLMTGEDNLVVTTWSDDGTLSLDLTGRFLKPDGEILPFVRSLTSGATTAGVVTPLPLGPGYLLNLSITAAAGAAVPWGRLYARVDVARGTVGPRVVLGTLIAGYVTSVMYLAWPGSAIVYPWDGAGFLEWLTIPDPAVGGRPSSAAPGISRWQIAAARTVLSTSATAGARRPVLQVRVGGVDYLEFGLPLAVGPSDTATCYWAAGMGGADQLLSGRSMGTIGADVWLLPTHEIRFDAQFMVATDAFTDTRVLLRKYLSIP